MSIKEVAKLAGVSISTVSRVVNGGQLSAASEETRKKIWEAVREVGYVPNKHAQNLRRGELEKKNYTELDCICPKNSFSDPFFVSLLQILEREATAHGFVIRLEYTIADLKKVRSKVNRSRSVIILGRCTDELVKTLKEMYAYQVFITLRDTDFPIDQIVCRGYIAVKQAITYLQSLGHRDICYIGELSGEPRYESFVSMMGKDAPAIMCRYTAADGYEAAQKFLKEGIRATAILCSNDILYSGILRALKENKRKVPRDISVIGINDMEHTRYEEPMMTAIQVPIEEMGRMAMDLILSHVDEAWRKKPVTIMFKSTLVVRDSCSAVRRKNQRKPKKNST